MYMERFKSNGKIGLIWDRVNKKYLTLDQAADVLNFYVKYNHELAKMVVKEGICEHRRDINEWRKD